MDTKYKMIITMKKRYIYLLGVCLFALLSFLLTACNDVIDMSEDTTVSGVSVIPNPMEPGQKISISGFNFSKATEVLFPDNITLTDFRKVGDNQIDVVVPAGTRSGRQITVVMPDGDYTIPIDIRLLEPKVTAAYAFSGAPDIGPHEALVIEGEDLINISEIVFPGEAQATVTAMNFRRKGNEKIIVVVPQGTDKVVSSMKLRSQYGMEITSTPVDFTGGGYIPPEYILLCGSDGSGKTWAWDEELADGIVYGNGGYRTDVKPAWWRIHIESLSSGVDGRDALGAKMHFSFSYDGSVLTKTFVDGTQIQGTYKLDVTKKVDKWDGTPWSVGRLEIIGGDEQITILGGTGSRWGVLKGFDILKLTENELVLANEYPDEPGTSAYYMFRVKE